MINIYEGVSPCEQTLGLELSVVLSVTGEVERETGLEPATFSLEGRGRLAQWHSSWRGERSVSSYRVVQALVRAGGKVGSMASSSPHQSRQTRPWGPGSATTAPMLTIG